jgi:uncharacterized membrane protein
MNEYNVAKCQGKVYASLFYYMCVCVELIFLNLIMHNILTVSFGRTYTFGFVLMPRAFY